MLGCELGLSYDCQSPPNAGEQKIRLIGFPMWGLILTHQYEIEEPRILSAEPCAGSIQGCAEAKLYIVMLRFRVRHKLKAGFTLGPFGKVAKEWVSTARSRTMRFLTEDVCCDPNYRTPSVEVPLSRAKPLHSGAALPVAAGGVSAPAITFGAIEGYSWWQILLAVCVGFLALSILIVFLRLAWRPITDACERLVQRGRTNEN